MRCYGELLDWTISLITRKNNEYGFQIMLVFEKEKLNRRKGGFLTYRDAEKEKERIIASFYNNSYIVDETICVEEFFRFWLEDVKRPQITHSTYLSYRSCVYNYTIPTMGNRYLHQIIRQDIENLFSVTASYSYGVARLLKTVITTSFKYALENHFISRNPSVELRMSKKEKTPDIHKKHTLNNWQIKRLIILSKETSLYLPILLATLLGMRRGEITGVKYSDVDYMQKTIHVQRQLGKAAIHSKNPLQTKQELPLKTPAANRVLKLPEIVFEAITEERARYEAHRSRRKKEFQDLGYVCCSSYGLPRSKDYFWKPFKDLLKENNLPDMKWHGLRHTYTTLLLKDNCGLREVSRSLGHTKTAFTANVYADTTIIIQGIIPDISKYVPEYKKPDYSNVIFPEKYLRELLTGTYL